MEFFMNDFQNQIFSVNSDNINQCNVDTQEVLSPFALVCKNYLESQCSLDTLLNQSLIKDNHAYNLCANFIISFVKDGLSDKSGNQIGFISDSDAYHKMKEFFIDNVCSLKLKEEIELKQKKQKEIEERKKFFDSTTKITPEDDYIQGELFDF